MKKFFGSLGEQIKMIFKIFWHDLGRIRKNIIAMIIIIGICVLPALYAWFNIAANWNPYSATSGIMVAVSNEDQGCTMENIQIRLGEEIINNLKSNDKMGWTFVDSEDARAGIESGKYYAAVIIPSDFSEKMTSFLTANMERPEIQYLVNQKKNAIAPKITDKGVEAIQQQVDSSFINTVTNYIATFLDTTGGKVQQEADEIYDQVIKDFNEVNNTLDSFEGHVDTYKSTIDTVVSLLQTNKAFLPSLQNTLDQAGNVTTSSQQAVDAVENSVETLVSSISQIVSSTESLYSSISGSVTGALQTMNSDMNAAASSLSGTTSYCQQIITVNNGIKEALTGISSKFGFDVSKLVAQIDKSNAIQQRMIDQLNGAADSLRTTGAIPLNDQDQLNQLVAETEASMAEVKNIYENQSKPAIQNGINTFFGEMQNVDDLLNQVSAQIPNMETTIDSLCTTLTTVKSGMDNLRQVAEDGKTRIKELTDKIDEIKNNENLKKLLDMIQKNPEKIAEFMSAPVQVDTISYYEIENYGSAMAPFYSTLAIWVGGIVLVAVLKVGVKEEEYVKNVRPTTAYFGRMLLFLTLGFIQATVIAIGDIYFLGIQCLYFKHFLFSCWIASFVFNMIIYTLTVAMGDIGKALAVIILVLQVAGSGGTFPIEVLPAFNQAVYPYLPFNYIIGAMRESVAGLYGNDYWMYIGKSLLFVPCALVLGVFLRRPFIHLNEFFERRVKKTGFM